MDEWMVEWVNDGHEMSDNVGFGVRMWSIDIYIYIDRWGEHLMTALQRTHQCTHICMHTQVYNHHLT